MTKSKVSSNKPIKTLSREVSFWKQQYYATRKEFDTFINEIFFVLQGFDANLSMDDDLWELSSLKEIMKNGVDLLEKLGNDAFANTRAYDRIISEFYKIDENESAT